MTATRSQAFRLTSSALWMTLLLSPLLAAHPLHQNSSQANAAIESKGSVPRIRLRIRNRTPAARSCFIMRRRALDTFRRCGPTA